MCKVCTEDAPKGQERSHVTVLLSFPHPNQGPGLVPGELIPTTKIQKEVIKRNDEQSLHL